MPLLTVVISAQNLVRFFSIIPYFPSEANVCKKKMK